MDGIKGEKCHLLTMICLTAIFFLVEIIIGYVTNSITLVEDSFRNMLTDIIALVVSFIALSLASKKWSLNTFGWARAEILGSLINALLLLYSNFSIAVEAFKRLIEPELIRRPKLVVIVGVFGLIVNIIGLFLFRDHGDDYEHGHSHEGKSHNYKPFMKLESAGENVNAIDGNDKDHRSYVPNNQSHNKHSAGQMNMRGVYLHFFANTLGSVVVIVSALVVWLTDWEYRNFMDPTLSILMVIIILRSASLLFQESALILLQTAPTHIRLEDIQERLLEIDGVLDVHELHVWQLTGDRIVASAHIRCTNLLEYMELAEKIKVFFHNKGIHSTTIQPEFVKFKTPLEDCILNCPRTNTSCQLQTCCGPTKQNQDTISHNDTPHLCRKRKTTSKTTDIIKHSQTDLAVNRNNGKNINIIVMVYLTACLFLVEITVGYATNSIALIANSFHMLTDIIALMVSYMALNMTSKKSSKNTFGWTRAEVLGSLANSLFLVALCFHITLEAFKRFIEIEPISDPKLIVIVGVLGLIVNIIGLFLFRGNGGGHGHDHSHGVKSHSHKPLMKLESTGENMNGIDDNDQDHRFYEPKNHAHDKHSAGQMNMRGVYLHFLADAIGSVIVIISALIVWLTEWEYRNYTDLASSIIMVIIILHSARPLLQESILILLQTAPDRIQVNEIQKTLMEIDEVLAVHEFHVWQLAGDIIIASAHIKCSNLSEYMKLAVKVKKIFHNKGIHSTTIQPEFQKIGGHGTISPVDTPYLSRKRETPSITTNCSNTDLTVVHNSRKKTGFIIMICLTACFFLVEIIVGYATNSMSLVADSFHMLSDILALMVSFIALNMASKKWSKNTFGWARAEVLGSLVNALFLIALCFTITVEALKRFIEIEPISDPKLIVIVGVLGLIVNIIGLFLFHGGGHGHGHSHGGKSHSHKPFMKLESAGENVNAVDENDKEHRFYVPKNHAHDEHSAEQMNMRGVYLHFLADAIGSVIVITSALIIWLTEWAYRDYIDPVLSVISVIIIVHSTWPLLYESALILLQTVPTHIQLDDIRERLLDIEGVLSVHELHVWQLTGDRIVASAHIRCINLSEYIDLAERVKLFFHNEGVHSTTIQPEFVNAEDRDVTSSVGTPCAWRDREQFTVNKNLPSAAICVPENCPDGELSAANCANTVRRECNNTCDATFVTIDTTKGLHTLNSLLETRV